MKNWASKRLNNLVKIIWNVEKPLRQIPPWLTPEQMLMYLLKLKEF